MSLPVECQDIVKAIEQNDLAALRLAVKEYARITVNPYLDTNGSMGTPTVPVTPKLRRYTIDTRFTTEGSVDNNKDVDWIAHERAWLGLLHYNVGNDCSRAQKYELALEMYTLAEKYDCNSSVLNNIATVLKRLGHYDEGVAYHMKNIQRYPHYEPAYARLAIMIEAYGVGSPTPAIDLLKQYYKIGGNDTQLDAFVEGTPEVERSALQRLLKLYRADRAYTNKRMIRQQTHTLKRKMAKIFGKEPPTGSWSTRDAIPWEPSYIRNLIANQRYLIYGITFNDVSIRMLHADGCISDDGELLVDRNGLFTYLVRTGKVPTLLKD